MSTRASNRTRQVSGGGGLSLLLVTSLVGAAACNSVLGLDYTVGVKCGDGTELVDGTCQRVAAADPKAPAFAGLASISVVGPTSLRLD